MSSGFTGAGVVRKRMPEIFAEFRDRLKQPTDPNDPSSAAFGPQITLDNPDQHPGDSLVAIGTAHSASTHELWEALEGLQNNLDASTANERFLRLFHAPRSGISENSTLSKDDLRALILQRECEGVPMASPATVALCDPNVECATVVRSTLQNPVDGMPANTAMIVVKGTPDWSDLANEMYKRVDFGLFDLVGDIQTSASLSVSDLCYRFQPACRVFVGLEIRVRRLGNCGVLDQALVSQTVVERLKELYSGCGFGQAFTSASLIAEIGPIDGFAIESIGLRRRAPMLVGKGCTQTDAPDVVINDILTNWSSSQICGYCQGEFWCLEFLDCLKLKPWEFADFDLAFTQTSEITGPTACA